MLDRRGRLLLTSLAFAGLRPEAGGTATEIQDAAPLARLVARHRRGHGRDGAPRIWPPAHAVRREGLARPSTRQGRSTHPRARQAPGGGARRATRRSARRGGAETDEV